MKRLTLLIALTLTVSTPVASGQSTLVSDDFSGTGHPSSAIWDSHANGGTLDQVNGRLVMRGIGSSFPYVRLQPDLALFHDNWSVEVRMAWPLSNADGVGFQGGSPAIPNGAPSCFGTFPFTRVLAAWRDNSGAASTGIRVGNSDFVAGVSDGDLHTYRWSCSGGVISFSLDGQVLASAPDPHVPLTSLWIGNPCTGAGGNWSQVDIDYVVVTEGAYGAYCFGDGSGTACPCGNIGAGPRGCANSTHPLGASLQGSGDASIAGDTLTLQGSGMPEGGPVLYFQGTQAVNAGMGVTFGDGLRCVGGTVTRLGTKINSAGASTYPAPGDEPISTRGHVTSPSTRTYQVWYRNVATFCTADPFNLSNGLHVSWTP